MKYAFIVAALLITGCAGALAQGRVNVGPYGRACPNHSSVDGTTVDCHGARKLNGGWDNSCFRLDYLPSEAACSEQH